MISRRRASKTNFVEVRTFLHLFRSFDRMWAFFILALQVMMPLSLHRSFCIHFSSVCHIICFSSLAGHGNYCLEPFWNTFFYISTRCFQKCIDNLHNSSIPQLPSRYKVQTYFDSRGFLHFLPYFFSHTALFNQVLINFDLYAES